MDKIIDITLKNRAILKSFLDDFSLESLNKIPKGFSNNIIWNIAHVVVTQQLLVYNLSGLPMIPSEDMIVRFRKGTKPERDLTQGEVDELKRLLFTTIEKTRIDYHKGIFKDFQEYTTSVKITLANVEDDMRFNNFHEGIHLGYILALRKSL